MNNHIISIISLKGGVGKTSITGNLAFALRDLKDKVLLIDFDPNNNLTDFICRDISLDKINESNSYIKLTRKKKPCECIVKTPLAQRQRTHSGKRFTLHKSESIENIIEST